MTGSFLGLFSSKRQSNPEQLIDTVIINLRRKVTEARLQLLAADLARKQLDKSSCTAEYDQSCKIIQQGIEKLENTYHEIETRRSILIARTRDADAHLAIERALMDVDCEPAEVALSMLADRASESKAEADAVAEIREISTSTGGDIDG